MDQSTLEQVKVELDNITLGFEHLYAATAKINQLCSSAKMPDLEHLQAKSVADVLPEVYMASVLSYAQTLKTLLALQITGDTFGNTLYDYVRGLQDTLNKLL